MVTKMVRITANVPRHIAERADEIAATRKLSRSKLVSECLLMMIEERERELLIEGYKAMAKKHEEFAKLTNYAAREALPEWQGK
jgi:metal-responsive CopG/Arc/MetJ family transcriptional regulator